MWPYLERTHGSLCLFSSRLHPISFSVCWFCFLVIHCSHDTSIYWDWWVFKWITEPGGVVLGTPNTCPSSAEGLHLVKVECSGLEYWHCSLDPWTAAPSLFGGAHGMVLVKAPWKHHITIQMHSDMIIILLLPWYVLVTAVSKTLLCTYRTLSCLPFG